MRLDNFQEGRQEIHSYEIPIFTFHHPFRKKFSNKYVFCDAEELN